MQKIFRGEVCKLIQAWGLFIEVCDFSQSWNTKKNYIPFESYISYNFGRAWTFFAFDKISKNWKIWFFECKLKHHQKIAKNEITFKYKNKKCEICIISLNSDCWNMNPSENLLNFWNVKQLFNENSTIYMSNSHTKVIQQKKNKRTNFHSFKCTNFSSFYAITK